MIELVISYSFHRKEQENAKETQRKNNSAYLCELISLRFSFFNAKNKRALRKRRGKNKRCVSLRSYFSALLFSTQRTRERQGNAEGKQNSA